MEVLYRFSESKSGAPQIGFFQWSIFDFEFNRLHNSIARFGY